MSSEGIMPGLKACSVEFSSPAGKFVNGKKIAVSCRTATEEAALTKTLTEFGATVCSCSCSCNSFSTEDHIATAFDQQCWKCIKRGLDLGPGSGPDLIFDDNGNAMLFICVGVKAEEIYAENGWSSDSIAGTQIYPSILVEENCLSIIVEELKTDPMRYRNLKDRLLGVFVGTATDSEQLRSILTSRFFSFPVFDVSVTKSKFCEMYGSRHAILGGIKKGTNMTISGKTALVCGYGDASHQGCAMALKKVGATVVVAEDDPNHATQAGLKCFSVTNNAAYNVSEADIVVVNFNSDNIDVLGNVKNMKNNVVIYNTSPNSRTHVALFEPFFPGMKQIILDCHTEKWVSCDTNKCVFVVRNPGYPNLMLSWSATSYVVAMLEFMSQKETGKYVGKFYAFPEHLEEKVSDLHLGELMASAAKKETEVQAAHLVSLPSQQRENPFTTTTADAMNISKMLIMLIQAIPIIGALVYALSKVSKAELSFTVIWGGGN